MWTRPPQRTRVTRVTGFLLLKWIHVMSAIVAVGSNVTYGVWSVQGKRDPEHLGFVLRGIKVLDQRVANPAYGVVLITGLVMAFTQYTIGTRWILTGLLIYIVMAGLATAVYTPTLRRQIERLDAEGPKGAGYIAAEARARGVGLFLGVLALFAVFVMVFKPTF
jgi:uncharacterized membrane protein